MAEQNQNYKVYDFQAVGEDLSTFRKNRRIGEAVSLPVGIKTPIELDQANGGLFVMHLTLTNQVKDNFKNLILTNHGERLGLYDYGANLRELTMELGNEAFDTEAIKRIKVACAKYMPYLSLNTFEPIIDRDGLPGGITKVGLKITYTIPLASSGLQQMDVILYAAG